MFSDNYIVYDKFSILGEEYISTVEIMPWKFTSLYDGEYLPSIESEVADKLNLFFRYRYVHSDEKLYDEFKNLIIEHRDGNILGYKIYNSMKYATVNGHKAFWKHFITSVDCTDLDLCKEKLDKMTDETDEMATDITHLSYDASGKFKSITIHDSKYNLLEYENNNTLKSINDLCKQTELGFKGLITLHPESGKIIFDLMKSYSPYSISPYRQIEGKLHDCEIIMHDNKYHRDRFKKNLLEYEILNQDHINYIDTIIQNNTRFDLAFDINEDGSLNDVHLLHYRIYEFQGLTTA
jgi:hypothetical protein